MHDWHIRSADTYRRLPAMLILTGMLLIVGASAYAQSMTFSSNALRRGWFGAPASRGIPQTIGVGNGNRSAIGDSLRDREDEQTNQALQPSPRAITDQ